MSVMMAQAALARRDLDREGAHEFIHKDQMVAWLLLNGNDVFAGILILAHGYSFEGLNSTTTRRMS